MERLKTETTRCTTDVPSLTETATGSQSSVRSGNFGRQVRPRHSHCRRRHAGDYGSEHSTELTGRRMAARVAVRDLGRTRILDDRVQAYTALSSDRCPHRQSRGLSATAPDTKDTGRPFEPSPRSKCTTSTRPETPQLSQSELKRSTSCTSARFRTDTERSVPPRLLPSDVSRASQRRAPRRPPSTARAEARRLQRRQLPRRAQRCGPDVLQVNRLSDARAGVRTADPLGPGC